MLRDNQVDKDLPMLLGTEGNGGGAASTTMNKVDISSHGKIAA